MNIAAAVKHPPVMIERADLSSPILFASGRVTLGIRAGTVIRLGERVHAFDADTPVRIAGDLSPGQDYGVGLDEDGAPFAALAGAENPLLDVWLAGFHFAPGGCAVARGGGDTVPAINPYSLWDGEFRFDGPDPRGMTLVDLPGGRRIWVDIYLLGVDHHRNGTSRCGDTIADGRDLPMRPDGSGRFRKLDYAAATEIYAHHGKRLLGAEEFFAASYGVKERCSRDDEPTVTGSLDDGAERFISARGVFDATGTMWQWGTDGDPDDPRPSIFGGGWLFGDGAGSRYASLVVWPGSSVDVLSARGCGDHLSPDAARAEARAF